MNKWIIGAVIVLGAGLAWYVLKPSDNSAELKALQTQLAEMKKVNDEWREENKLLQDQREKDRLASERRDADHRRSDYAREQYVRSLEQSLKARLEAVERASVPELSARWSELAGLPLSSYRLQGDSLCLTELAIRATVKKLEEGAAAIHIIAEKDRQIAETRASIAELDSQIKGFKAEVAMLREDLSRTANEHDVALKLKDEEVKREKANASKWKRRTLAIATAGIAIIFFVAR